jgi:hypothetical protein
MSLKQGFSILHKLVVIAAITLVIPAVANSKPLDQIVPKELPIGAVFDDSFVANAKVGANINFSHNQNFVGQLDGQTWTFGAAVDTGYTLVRKGHDWRSQLKLLASFTYGPPINRFMKTSDQFYFDTRYFYHPKGYEWIGPYASFTMETSMFEGTNVSQGPVDYMVTNETAAGDRTLAGEANPDPKMYLGKTRLKLADSFMPMTLKEAAGLYARPLLKPEIEMIFLLGFGAVEVVADKQYSVSDAASAPIKLVRLNSYSQGGLAGGLTMKGELYKKKITYQANAEFMVPFLRTKDANDNRTVAQLTNVDFGVSLSFRLVSWASVDYLFKCVRQPQLAEGWQFQNMLMLSFAYNYAYDEKAAKEKAAADAAKKAADLALDAAITEGTVEAATAGQEAPAPAEPAPAK